MNWLARNSTSVQALSAILTAILALGALIGLKIQLDEADRIQSLQSAREAYRSHLTLAISNPEFAEPEDTCALLATQKAASYTAFVDHLLYSAEQMLDAEDNWEQTFKEELMPHVQYLCQENPALELTLKANKLVNTIIAEQCSKVASCQQE